VEKKYEPCGRCGGQGSYTTTLGAPGQDHRETGGWASVTGKTTYGPFTCGVCLGTGWRKPPRDLPNQLFFAVHSTKADQMSFNEIFDAMKLPTKKEPT